MRQDEIDEIIGITRCVRCGHRLDGDIECPFCAVFPATERKEGLPKWIYITACFLSSPFSLYAIIKTDRLSIREKILTFSGCFFWAGLFTYLYLR